MRQLLDDDDGIEERRARAAPLIRHLDAHDPKVEEAADQLFWHCRLAIHVVNERPDLLDRELAHALLEHLLLVGEYGERRTGGDFDGRGHLADYRTQD